MNAPRNLVLSGGGLKGLAFCGVFKALEEANYRDGIKNVCTVSIGAIMGLLFVLGYSSTEIQNIIVSKDFSTLIEPRIRNLFVKYGCDKGQKIVDWLKEVLAHKGLHPDITFKQLQSVTGGIVFTVCATNLNTFSPTFFNVHTAPNLSVVKAIRMSISIPIIFSPVIFEKNYFIDGSVSNNFPICFFKDDLQNTLGVKLVSNGELEESNYQIDSFFTFVIKCISCMIVNKDKFTTINHAEKCMFLRTEKYEQYFLDFNMSDDIKSQIIHLGYTTAQAYLQKHLQSSSELSNLE